MRLTVISVGKNAEGFVRDACEEYAGRIRRYADLRLTVVPEERVSSSGKRAYILRQEGRRIRDKIPPPAVCVALDERGRKYTSPELARQFVEWTAGRRELVFIIGGAYGLDEEVKQGADFLLSLSCMTLTHGMARMILLEQIYRAFTLIHKEPYHK